MKYDLIRPCPHCPFRNDRPGYLGRAGAMRIIDSILRGATFSCHETNRAGENEHGEQELVETENSKHCAGALIILEILERPHQMMRIAERLGLYDMTKLDMDAPVFQSRAEFIRQHTLKDRP
jgi:hypothetical protein